MPNPSRWCSLHGVKQSLPHGAIRAIRSRPRDRGTAQRRCKTCAAGSAVSGPSNLAETSGELITREQLQSQIWPKDTFVDFDHALNTAITKIRIALGEMLSTRSTSRRCLGGAIALSLQVEKCLESNRRDSGATAGVGSENQKDRWLVGSIVALRLWVCCSLLLPGGLPEIRCNTVGLD